MSDKEAFMDSLLMATLNHSEDDPDTEVGDLQVLLLDAVDLMTPEQFEQFKVSAMVQDIMSFTPGESQDAVGHAERLEQETPDEDSAYVTLGDDLVDDSNPFADEDHEDD